MSVPESQPDPRRENARRSPRVTVGHIDPCLLFLEATEPGEIPVLFLAWARSSVETRGLDGTTYLKLGEITILTGRPVRGSLGWNMEDGQTPWSFLGCPSVAEATLAHRPGTGWSLQGLPLGLGDQSDRPLHGFQGSLKFIDDKTDFRLRALDQMSLDRPRVNPDLTRALLAQGPDWPSLINALASIKPAPKAAEPVRSLLRRIVRTVADKLVGV
jgi:hypothetical protein